MVGFTNNIQKCINCYGILRKRCYNGIMLIYKIRGLLCVKAFIIDFYLGGSIFNESRF